jgi:hypothetical protein
MEFLGLLINPPEVFVALHILAVVPLIARHKFDATVARPVVVPIHKIYNPQAGLLLAPSARKDDVSAAVVNPIA